MGFAKGLGTCSSAEHIVPFRYPFVRGKGVLNGYSSTRVSPWDSLMFGRLAMGFANVRASRYLQQRLGVVVVVLHREAHPLLRALALRQAGA